MTEPDASFVELKCSTCPRAMPVEVVDGLATWPNDWRVTGARFSRVVCPTCAKKLRAASDGEKMTS